MPKYPNAQTFKYINRRLKKQLKDANNKFNAFIDL